MRILFALMLLASSGLNAGVLMPWSDTTLKAAWNIPNTRTDDSQPAAAYLDCSYNYGQGSPADAYPYTTNATYSGAAGNDNFYILQRAASTVFTNANGLRWTRPAISVVVRKTLWFTYVYGGQTTTIGVAPGTYDSTVAGYKYKHGEILLGTTPLSTSRPDFSFGGDATWFADVFNGQSWFDAPFEAWMNVTIGGVNKRFYLLCGVSEFL